MKGRAGLPNPGLTVWVLRWVALYTRGLPEGAARDRADEIASDLFEHNAAAVAADQSKRATTLSILTRALTGMGADVLWRERQLQQEHRRQLSVASPALRTRYSRVARGAVALGAAVAILTLASTIRVLTNVPTAWGVSSVTGQIAVTVGVLLALLALLRSSSRILGALFFAALSLPLCLAVAQNTMYISLTLAQVMQSALAPFAATSYYLAFAVLFIPAYLLIAVFMTIAVRLRALHRRIRLEAYTPAHETTMLY
ncbi:hypothetical protein [Agreia pratensis]|uniref:Uncharacterized protein n=1 Tax=Agreia pratensis TaxID=150121 RepID=A0A1X7JF10_9MICO|nr:hypothetical protein [Agreia pratensis]SMG26625.1 hypothetical protein SAMN06296010_1348 [Agreia pratensis]